MQAKETYKAGDPVTAKLGPGLAFYLKPFVRLPNITTFDLDDSTATAICPISAFRRPTAWNPRYLQLSGGKIGLQLSDS